MDITLKAFATVKDIFGFDEKQISTQPNLTVKMFLDLMETDYPDICKIRSSLLFAVNGNYCSSDTMLKNSDILAVFPPVSGG